jgi:hypothetical protein
VRISGDDKQMIAVRIRVLRRRALHKISVGFLGGRGIGKL